ncbi:MAG: VTT domain-containing protein [Panacagrimonas sp.]
MLEHAQALLAWIGAHPRESLVLLFFVSLTDALFLVGAFVPAAIVLFGMGALVALGSLELWPTALIAAVGALTGDAISFALGRRYGEALFESRLLRRYPDLIAGGRSFFARHGGKGVMLARFLGPVRSITPALAGASSMSVWLFLTVDFVAAVGWALVYLIPGVLFGASLGLAAEVATRLAGLLVLSIVLLILGVWAVRAAIALFNRYAEQWVTRILDWSRRHRHLGRFGPGLADPSQPETPALLAVGSLLLASGAIWLLSFGGAGWRVYPGAMDALIHQTLSDLSTPWGTAVAGAIARLGQWPVYGSTAVAVLAALLWRRRLHAAAHWIAALVFGVLLTALLSLAPLLPPPAMFFGHANGATVPLRDLAMPTIIYGFAAVLIATWRPQQVRMLAYGMAIALVLLISLSRLVLAQEWISLNSFAVVMGLLWIAALTLGYRQHRPERLFAASFSLPVAAAFLLAASMSWGVDRAAHQPPTPAPETTAREMPLDLWWDQGWSELPLARIDARGRGLRPFDFQWAASEAVIEAELRAAGWRTLPPLRPTDTLRWLTQTTLISELPVLPQVHAGMHPRLSLRRRIDGERQRLVRVWDSGVRVASDEGLVPVWLGTLSEQRVRTFYRLFRYPVTEPDAPVLPPLPGRTERTTIRAVERDGHRVWLMGAAAVLYTEPMPEVPLGAPVPLTSP